MSQSFWFLPRIIYLLITYIKKMVVHRPLISYPSSHMCVQPSHTTYYFSNENPKSGIPSNEGAPALGVSTMETSISSSKKVVMEFAVEERCRIKSPIFFVNRLATPLVLRGFWLVGKGVPVVVVVGWLVFENIIQSSDFQKESHTIVP